MPRIITQRRPIIAATTLRGPPRSAGADAGPASAPRRPVLGAVLLSACLLAIASPARADRQTFRIDAATLTREAAPHFPQRRCLLGLACVTLSDPRVVLRSGDDRLYLVARARPEIAMAPPGEPLPAGEVEIGGRLRYEAAAGAFFLDRPTVLRLDFPGLPQAYALPAAEVVAILVGDFLQQTPVHVLDERDSRQALARLVLRSVKVENGVLLLTVGDDE